MHVHVSALEALATVSYVIVFGFLWRFVAAKLAGTPLGEAMAYIW